MLRSAAATLLAIIAAAVPGQASEIWVAPTHQQDLGGLGVGSNGIWPVTPAGVARLAWAVPDDLASFRGARLVLIPQAAAAGATLTLYVCRAARSELVNAACAGPLTQSFSSAANQLLEIDITTTIAPRIGSAGQSHLAIVAFTSSAATDRILGLRFAYDPALPGGAATLGDNAFTGTQSAPAFAGDGARLINVDAARLEGLDSRAFARSIHAHDVTQVANAASLGSNAFAGTQTVTGHVNVVSTDTILARSGARLLHGRNLNLFLGSGGNDTYTGSGNIGIGSSTLAGLAQGISNVAIGNNALQGAIGGSGNTAIGLDSLKNNQTGNANSAVGQGTLGFGSQGSGNTAIGHSALFLTTGDNNTAIGRNALLDNGIGANNLALGLSAGLGLTSGSNNIYLGALAGATNETGTMHLGRVGMQQRAFIAGTRGVTTGANNAVPVVIDSNGQLGTISSSRRYKEDVGDMADASRRVLALRPVTFRYSRAFADGTKPVQFGLIAEEVADVFPELVVRDDEGRPETVQYQHLSVLLLNELQRLQKRVDDLERRVSAVRQP